MYTLIKVMIGAIFLTGCTLGYRPQNDRIFLCDPSNLTSFDDQGRPILIVGDLRIRTTSNQVGGISSAVVDYKGEQHSVAVPRPDGRQNGILLRFTDEKGEQFVISDDRVQRNVRLRSLSNDGPWQVCELSISPVS